MKRNISIQLKAALLLIVFSMNTVIGFACAMGVDMSFNTKHHDDEAIQTMIHVHADGKKHNHHHEAAKHHHNSKEESQKEGCCNDGVVKFQSLDKNLNTNTNSVIAVPLFVAIHTSFFAVDILAWKQVSDSKNIALFFHPPPPEIRVLIQSFQI